MLDILIRGGVIVDGGGGAPFEADVGIRDGLIVSVGRAGDEPAGRIVEAGGLAVTPGFVDVHTHYDGQATWDSDLKPSSLHGVTTVVMGNCGVGFAPVRAQDREWLIRLMEGVEDIPGTVLSEGICWRWETFPAYLRTLGERRFAVDVAAQIPHGPVRTYVMGARGADHLAEPDDAEIAAMARLVKEALRCGAVGFTTSRTVAHRSSDGSYTPSLSATPRELLAIARAMGEVGTGVFEIVSDFNPLEEEFALIREIAVASGRPVSVALTQTNEQPQAWRRILQLIAEARDAGLDIHAQVASKPISVLFGLSNGAHFLKLSSTYREMAALPVAEQAGRLRDAAIKRRILDEIDQAPAAAKAFLCNWHELYRFARDLRYLPDPDESVARVAEARGADPESVAYDWLIEGEGAQFLFMPSRNYAEGNDRALRDMITSAHSILGLGDAGAHCGVLCDASVPTFLLTYWRNKAEDALALEFIVNQLTLRVAEAWGLHDRGLIAVGRRADVNLIDLDRLRLEMPAYVTDLPAGGGRLMQGAEGYVMTLVGGVPVIDDGERTGERPGRLIARTVPA